MTDHDQPATAKSAVADPATIPPQTERDEPRESRDHETVQSRNGEPAERRHHQQPARIAHEQPPTPDRHDQGAESPPADNQLQDLTPLFQTPHTKEIQQRWHDIQATFVDDPHDALRQAGELNDEIVISLATALDDRKHTLEQEISNGDTERLRIGLRKYHQMLDQILTL